MVDFLIREAPLHNDLLAPACLNYLPALPDFYLHVGIDELATTSTLFLLEVPPSIMEGRFDLPGTIESLLRNSESVPIVMATVGDAYHTILQQVSVLIAPKFLLF